MTWCSRATDVCLFLAQLNSSSGEKGRRQPQPQPPTQTPYLEKARTIMEYHSVPVEERAKDEKGNLLPWGYMYKE